MISVVIPAYNCENTIRECINSIMNQTYTDFEIIVINDGSTDETKRIVEHLSKKDGRIRIIDQENSGVSTSRNVGIDNSNGKHIVFVDSDDYVGVDYLKTLYDMSETNIMPVVNFTHNYGGNGLLPICNEVEFIKLDTPQLSESYLVGDLGRKIAFSVWNKLFDIEILKKNNIRFNSDLTMGEDMLFVLKYICYCNGIKMNSLPLYYYVIRLDSAINSKHSDFSLKYENTYKCLKSFSENGVSVENSILSKWSLEIMPYVLLNEYVTTMNMFEFKDYFNDLLNKEFVNSALQNKQRSSVKKKFIQLSFKYKNHIMMYILIKFNKIYRKILK